MKTFLRWCALCAVISSILSSSKAHAQTFQWVWNAAPPAGAVSAPSGAILCRGLASGTLFPGIWSRGSCNAFYGFTGSSHLAQFLAVRSGAAHWQTPPIGAVNGRQPAPGRLNPATLGNFVHLNGAPMCFLGGSGSLVQNTDMGAACNINPAGLRLTTQLPVLLAGAMASPDTAVEDVYTWAAAPKPGVPAFGLPHWNDVEVGKQMFVCLGSNSEIGSFSIVGSGHDGTCFGAYSGGTYTLSNVQWLVQLDGAPHWVQGNGKIIAGDVGTPPGPALTYAGALLCSQGGMVGFNYSNQCSISSYDPLMWLPADMKQQPGLGPTPFDIGGSTPAYVLSGRIL